MLKKNKNRYGEVDVVYKGTYQTLRTLMHFVAAVQFWYSIYYDFTYVHFPLSANNMHNPFGGKFKYLTFLDAIIQALYFTISLINDFVGRNDVAPKQPLPLLRKFKDYLMAAFAFPIALNVGITFWGLYAIDRELVFPKVLDAVFPSWLNHIMHTNIVLFIVLEMCTSFRTYPKRLNGIVGLSLFMLAYLMWLHVIKYYSGVWVYPVLEVLDFPQRILFFVFSLIFTLGLYIFGELMNNTIWSNEVKLTHHKMK